MRDYADWRVSSSTPVSHSLAQIKSAIAAYGPVTAGVCVGQAFSNYTGGVFSTDESCGGWNTKFTPSGSSKENPRSAERPIPFCSSRTTSICRRPSQAY